MQHKERPIREKRWTVMPILLDIMKKLSSDQNLFVFADKPALMEIKSWSSLKKKKKKLAILCLKIVATKEKNFMTPKEKEDTSFANTAFNI